MGITNHKGERPISMLLPERGDSLKQFYRQPPKQASDKEREDCKEYFGLHKRTRRLNKGIACTHPDGTYKKGYGPNGRIKTTKTSTSHATSATA